MELNKVIDASESQQVKSSTVKNVESVTEKKGKRRGVWKRVRVRPIDSFETAESQNIGKHFYNSLVTDQNQKEFGERFQNKNLNTNFNENDDENIAVTEENASTELDTDENVKNDEEITTIKNLVETTTLPSETEAITLASAELTTTNNNNDANIGYTAAEEAENQTDEAVTTTTIGQTESPAEVDTQAATTLPPTVIDTDDSEKPTDRPDIEAEVSESQRKMVTVSADDAEPTETDSNSIMDEVKQRLTELFSFDDDNVVVSTTERVFRINRNFNRPKPAVPHYMTIDRHHAVNEILNEKEIEKENDKSYDNTAEISTMKLEPVPVLKTLLRPVTEKSSFHKDLMDSVIFATSTSTEISHETEICYRGRCVKTQQKP